MESEISHNSPPLVPMRGWIQSTFLRAMSWVTCCNALFLHTASYLQVGGLSLVGCPKCVPMSSLSTYHTISSSSVLLILTYVRSCTCASVLHTWEISYKVYAKSWLSKGERNKENFFYRSLEGIARSAKWLGNGIQSSLPVTGRNMSFQYHVRD